MGLEMLCFWGQKRFGSCPRMHTKKLHVKKTIHVGMTKGQCPAPVPLSTSTRPPVIRCRPCLSQRTNFCRANKLARNAEDANIEQEGVTHAMHYSD